MNSTKILPVLLVLAALLSGCAILDPHDRDTNVYEGLYAWGFEVNAFRACDETGLWWVVASNDVSGVADSLLANYNRIADNQYDEVYVRFRGHPGPKGTYGHLGSYEREFFLDDVVEMRKASAGDCD